MEVKTGIRLHALAAAVLAAAALAGSRDPFPLGHAMMSQGAILESEGATGREPWVSAAYYRDTLRWGAAVSAVSYHGGGSASQYAAGGFAAAGPVVGKVSLMQLDGLRVYYEQTASLSAGISWRPLSFGIDARLHRTGLYDNADAARATVSLGAAVLLRARRLTADAAVQNIPALTVGITGVDPDPVITARVCTVRNRYGSQGAMIKISPRDESPVRFVLAQEYRIGPAFALAASIASNPTMIGFGLSVDKSQATGSTAVVNHPFLGWSKGAAVDYGR